MASLVCVPDASARGATPLWTTAHQGLHTLLVVIPIWVRAIVNPAMAPFLEMFRRTDHVPKIAVVRVGCPYAAPLGVHLYMPVPPLPFRVIVRVHSHEIEFRVVLAAIHCPAHPLVVVGRRELEDVARPLLEAGERGRAVELLAACHWWSLAALPLIPLLDQPLYQEVL